MRSSLEYACEEFFIRIFQADSRLSGKTIVHFDDERKAKSDAIIVQGKEGNHNLAGPGGFDVEMMVEYRSPIGTTKAISDLISAAIRESVYASPLAIKARAGMARKAGLSELVIKDESTSERQNSEDLRRRIITFPLQAKLH